MLKLSFKQKLIALILITLAGIICISAVAFNTLYALNSAASRVSQLTSVSDTLSSMQLDMVTTENNLAQLSDANAEIFTASVITIVDTYQPLLTEYAAETDSSRLKEALQRVEAAFLKYEESIVSQIGSLKSLGFNNNSGVMLSLQKNAVKLNEQLAPFSAFSKDFIIARQLEKEYLISPTDSAAEKLIKQMDVVVSSIKEAEFYDAFGKDIEAYQASLKEVIVAASLKSKTHQQMLENRAIFSDNSQKTQQFVKSDLLISAKSKAESTTSNAKWTLGLVSIGVGIIVTFVLIMISVKTTSTLKIIIHHLRAIAQGELNQNIPVNETHQDEFDHVSSAVNTTANDLRTLIGQVIDSQKMLNQQATELSNSVQTIAENNSVVSDQSNTLASATEQISVTANHVADSIKSLNNETDSAHQAAINGGNTIQLAMQALTRTSDIVEQSSQQLVQLQKDSKKIDSVLEIINGLADQTNLLALNAAIEAARAGDAGRGFSVVADEVRSLAERTVSATGEITQTVRAIQKQTDDVIATMEQSQSSLENVKKQSDDAQSAVRQIEEQTRQASLTSHEIYDSIAEVARTTTEMATSMDSIAHVIEDNKTASQVIVVSSDSLLSSATKMGQMTSKFRL
ncbi:methyl-accepting chemotaxis protein [Neptunomonas antarctica]|uniref:Methyl-accepting chemotaxis protein n=1 Tax=Neptunomonas antarctica TaxID=619304 RepID=A0A1N7L3F3_9GAMM|nr:methyl-accepting chemotaxis protein [Neptunomonas antarctica]SIS68334.1 methyl-accepting chemotaxis protein [Neptunomonas antarctica]